MKLRALSFYGNDKDTRFGDCILIYDSTTLNVYDCGHKNHKDSVVAFLSANKLITNINIIVSHNDSDHTNGVIELLEWLESQNKYKVNVYTHQYLKHVDEILDKIDDNRRRRERLKEALLVEFDNIKEIIEKTIELKFSALEALEGTIIGSSKIVGPTIDEFTDVAAKAVDKRESNKIGEGNAEETVMNAASVQLRCSIDNLGSILLCGDATPDYLKNLDSYSIIQLPHHGQLDNATSIFDRLKDPYSKVYLVSDNTGSSSTSGGSDKLVKYMKDEKYNEPLNTKKGVVDIPNSTLTLSPSRSMQGVRLGEVDNR